MSGAFALAAQERVGPVLRCFRSLGVAPLTLVGGALRLLASVTVVVPPTTHEGDVAFQDFSSFGRRVVAFHVFSSSRREFSYISA